MFRSLNEPDQLYIVFGPGEISTMTMFVRSNGSYHGTEFDYIDSMVVIMDREHVLPKVELELGNQATRTNLTQGRQLDNGRYRV